jgi:hypothetical protein
VLACRDNALIIEIVPRCTYEVLSCIF